MSKKLSIFDICETDVDAEENGRWFNDIFGDQSGIDVKLRRMTSKVAVMARQRIEKPFRRLTPRGDLKPEQNIEILCKQMGEAIICDWRGIVDKDENPIEYSAEAAEALLMKLPNFRLQILAFASNMDNFRLEDLKALEKN